LAGKSGLQKGRFFVGHVNPLIVELFNSLTCETKLSLSACLRDRPQKTSAVTAGFVKCGPVAD